MHIKSKLSFLYLPFYFLITQFMRINHKMLLSFNAHILMAKVPQHFACQSCFYNWHLNDAQENNQFCKASIGN